MTFVGHSLVGAALAQTTLPGGVSWKQWLLVVNLYVLLAFFPDLPLPGWGHSAYFFSHSLFVNLALVIPLTAAGLRWRRHIPLGSAPLVCGAALAWLTHFPLDALYNHGQGVAIYWPLSEGSLNLALPWFETLDMRVPLTAGRNARVFLVEAVVFLPLLMAAVAGRSAWQRHQKRAGGAR
jgi:membrane-bound metal-dependent hydrolase YbcI (DUF457 family)